MKFLAVYYGLTEIFLSISDPMELTASPFKSIPHKNWMVTRLALHDIVEENEIDRLIFVMPLNRKAQASKKSSKSITFSEFLKKGLTVPVDVYEEICAFPDKKKEQLIPNLLLQNFLDKRYMEKQIQDERE